MKEQAMRLCLCAATLCLSALLSLPESRAEQRPMWEAGLGAAVLNLPDYRGADTRSTYVLPLPYLIYRGRFLKADREGIRGTLFDSDRVQLNLSLNGTLPVSSKDNPARRGMASLKPSVEFGPTASIRLWESADEKKTLDLRVPLRTAITVESSPRQIGWLFSPGLNLRVQDPAGFTGWNAGLLAGALFHSRSNNAYFYSVTPAEATATRPAYEAGGGFSGTQVTLSISKRFPRYWVGGFMRYDNLTGAVFADSPLVKQRSGISAGFGIAWIFGESSTRVDVEE